MFVIKEDKSIYLTRGDVAFFSIAVKTDTGEAYKFQVGDVVRFKVTEKKACENVVLSKDFGIEVETEEVEIYLEEKDTKIGEVISKPVDYWYEVELNPFSDPQTLIGYDEDGAKIFKLFPEGNEAEDDSPITPEDIPVVDEEFSITSTRPVQNQVIARAFITLKEDVKREVDSYKATTDQVLEDFGKEVNKSLSSFNETIEEKLTALDERYNEEITNLEEMEETVSNLCDQFTSFSVHKKTFKSLTTDALGRIDELLFQNELKLSAINDILFARGCSSDDDTLFYDVRFYKFPDWGFSKGFRWVFVFNAVGTAITPENLDVDLDIYYIPSVMVDAN